MPLNILQSLTLTTSVQNTLIEMKHKESVSSIKYCTWESIVSQPVLCVLYIQKATSISDPSKLEVTSAKATTSIDATDPRTKNVTLYSTVEGNGASFLLMS